MERVSIKDANGFNAFLEKLKRDQKEGVAIIFALRLNNDDFKGRNIGIEITDVTPENIARAIAILARSGKSITQAIEENGYKEADVENTDCSGAIKVYPDGSAEISFFAGQGLSSAVLKFDPSGQRIE